MVFLQNINEPVLSLGFDAPKSQNKTAAKAWHGATHSAKTDGHTAPSAGSRSVFFALKRWRNPWKGQDLVLLFCFFALFHGLLYIFFDFLKSI